jgi:hypothetical protein
MSWVFQGLSDAFAIVLPIKKLMSEDFPTLDLPITATSGKFELGHSVILEADLMKARE